MNKETKKQQDLTPEDKLMQAIFGKPLNQLIEEEKQEISNDLKMRLKDRMFGERPEEEEFTKARRAKEDSPGSMQEEPVSEDLEKAAIEAFKQIVDNGKNSFLEIFKAGVSWYKERMMKNAVEGMLFFNICQEPCFLVNDCENLKQGDKVKLIIVKED